MDVYDRIDQFINAKGLSRRKLAGLAGIAPATLNSALARKAGLSPINLSKIADKLGVNVDFLLYGDVTKELGIIRGEDFFRENGIGESLQEKVEEGSLLKDYRLLREDGRITARHIIGAMRRDPHYADFERIAAYEKWIEKINIDMGDENDGQPSSPANT